MDRQRRNYRKFTKKKKNKESNNQKSDAKSDLLAPALAPTELLSSTRPNQQSDEQEIKGACPLCKSERKFIPRCIAIEKLEITRKIWKRFLL